MKTKTYLMSIVILCMGYFASLYVLLLFDGEYNLFSKIDDIGAPKGPEVIYLEHNYPEMDKVLANDSLMDIHHFWGVETIEYYDWEETANALGIPVELLTVDLYMDAFNKDISSEYIYLYDSEGVGRWMKVYKHNKQSN